MHSKVQHLLQYQTYCRSLKISYYCAKRIDPLHPRVQVLTSQNNHSCLSPNMRVASKSNFSKWDQARLIVLRCQDLSVKMKIRLEKLLKLEIIPHICRDVGDVQRCANSTSVLQQYEEQGPQLLN
ncbi:hypothetical protein M758_UG275600 [Ceratodon purpureus]|nr:hypothetical protein M758_UG275600 [Ceratodon purpureus]